MGTLKEMFSGYINLLGDKEKELALSRAAECDICPSQTKVKTCKECGCYLPAKVRSETSKCPLGKW